MNVVDILSTTSDELREAGIISPDLISKIISTLKEWLERVMNRDTAVNYEVREAVDKNSANDINNDVLSFFFDMDDESDNVESGDSEKNEMREAL